MFENQIDTLQKYPTHKISIVSIIEPQINHKIINSQIPFSYDNRKRLLKAQSVPKQLVDSLEIARNRLNILK